MKLHVRTQQQQLKQGVMEEEGNVQTRLTYIMSRDKY